MIVTIPWEDGEGNITLNYNGYKNDTVIVQSDSNTLYEERAAQIVIKTSDGSNISRTVTIKQAAKEKINISSAIVTAANQTYNGSAFTPTPTVTLDGTTIPSSGYDVSYSDNTNAGTATITVTGKGNYTGVATGTFTINKANPNYSAPSKRNNLTYTGNSQYLITSGYTTDGTIQYSSDNSSWSTTRPSKTNAGTYTVYWRLVGDSNHTDVNSTSITVPIAKASRTLSFVDSYVVIDLSSTVTKTATPSAGSGDGSITYSISNTNYATINSSSGKVTSKTSNGSATVTATIAEGTNYLSATTSYILYVFATVNTYSYSGNDENVTLPPGTYQLQCWGAQGGSNGANSTYGIIAQAGGKGGYSVGQLTLTQATNFKVYVGGQGSSSAGGFNGGGSTTGTSQYNASDELGYSKIGGGGGATDIRLSDGALLSRIIVAGGGGGGAMCYKSVTTKSSITVLSGTWVFSQKGTYKYFKQSGTTYNADSGLVFGKKYKVTFTPSTSSTYVDITWRSSTGSWVAEATYNANTEFTLESKSGASYVSLYIRGPLDLSDSTTFSVTVTEETSTTTTSTESQVGGVGGGTQGGAYSSTYAGKQSSAGSGGSFGQGANQATTNYRYCSGAGGGGWYGGGGGQKSDSSMTYCKYSGGGSGFVNTAASAGNRPSGYTGLELDSGETKAGNTSFPNTAGTGNETGHSGSGYAKITRLS